MDEEDVQEVLARTQQQEIIGTSMELCAALEHLSKVARTDATVLIHGETGTGKELFARALHAQSTRSERVFVTLNCAAIPANLFESELFGHERGAFTGAHARYIGHFEQAEGGTLFLDEIGELPLDLQPKLLRMLQEREFERLGSTRTRHADVRIVAATNQDLETLVREKRFREDLFYRLSVFPIRVPPLRERRRDVPLLVEHFVRKFGARMNKPVGVPSAANLAELLAHSWPGNVRELEHVVERAVILSGEGTLDIRLHERSALDAGRHMPGDALADVNRAHILAVLRSANWVVAGPNGAAARLGVKRTTLNFKMKKLGIRREVEAGRARSFSA